MFSMLLLNVLILISVNSEKTFHRFKIYINRDSINYDHSISKTSIKKAEKALNLTSEILGNILLINSGGKILSKLNISKICNITINYINEDIENEDYIKADFILFPIIDKNQEEFITHKICLNSNKSKRPLIGYLKLNEFFDFDLSKNELTTVFLHHIIHLIGFNLNVLQNNINIFINKNYITYKDSELLNELIFLNKKKELEIEEYNNDIHFNNNLNYNDFMKPDEDNFLISPFSLSLLNSIDFYYVILPYLTFDFYTYSYNVNSYLIKNFHLIEIGSCYGDTFILKFKMENKCKNSLREFESNITIGKFPELKDIKEQTINLLSPSKYCKNPQKTLFFKYPSIVGITQDFTLVSKKTFNLKEYMIVSCQFFNNEDFSPDILKDIFFLTNITRTYNLNYGNILWYNSGFLTDSPFLLNYYQKYNRFFTSNEITRKDLLYFNYQQFQKKFPKDFTFIPETYIGLTNYDLLKDKFQNYTLNITNLWLVKPPDEARGIGIKFLKNFTNDIDKYSIITRYLSNPHLINGKKYDLRIYILITGHSPLKIYIYDEGIVRRASEKYSIDINNIDNNYVHITNVAINYKKDISNIKEDNKDNSIIWDFNQLKKYLEKEGKNFDFIFEQIKDIAVKIFISITKIQRDAEEDNIQFNLNSQNLFELYGLDILIDENLKAWLLEVNLSPSIEAIGEYEEKMKYKLLADLFNIIGIKPFSHFDLQPYEEGIYFQDKFDEIIHESICEFTRPNGGFHRIFPLKDNIDYYQKFFEDIGDENLMLWKKIKNITEL